jgi:hypothetical protein
LNAHVGQKADHQSLIEVSGLAYRLKQEVLDTNKKQQQLLVQFSQFIDSLQVNKTHFQLELLEKKIEGLELKLSEERHSEIDFSDTIKNTDLKIPLIPRRSMRLTDIIDRSANLGPDLTRQKFNTIVKNKKLS